MNKSAIMTAFATATVLLSGCGTSPHRIDATGNQGLTTTEDINFKDWQTAASNSIESLLQSGVLDRQIYKKKAAQNLPYEPQVVIMVSDVKNKTTNHIETNILTNQIRQALLKSGKALTTTAVGATGAEDKASRQVRDLKHDQMFKQSTVVKEGTAIAPEMSLAGEIIQQNTSQGRSKEAYFQFHMTLTDIETGLALWEDYVEIAKQSTKPLIGF